jgi:membrane-associated protease RseP (regulator of RpoE activity)
VLPAAVEAARSFSSPDAVEVAFPLDVSSLQDPQNPGWPGGPSRYGMIPVPISAHCSRFWLFYWSRAPFISMHVLSMHIRCGILSRTFGGGWVPVGSPVFKTGGGSFSGPRWVRLPSTPALYFLVTGMDISGLVFDQDRLLQSVRSVMAVSEVSYGTEKDSFRIRYAGQLSIDPGQAFLVLDPLFLKEGLTVFLYEQDGKHVVEGMQGVIEPQPSNPWVNLILFLFTLMSMLLAGTLYGYQGPVSGSVSTIIAGVMGNITNGLLFAGGLMSILLAHEFGHYLAARANRTAVTLPYFLPFPGSLFGTFGAFIRLKEPPRDRNVLLDIGLSGPLAGFLVTIPVLLIGLSMSEVGLLPAGPEAAGGSVLEGNSILYLIAKFVSTGEWLPQPVTYGGIEPLIYWVRYIFSGSPVPFGGRDILMSPLAWAGWAGLLITALNLIPAGQLDGGHILYVLIGDAASRLWPFIVIALLLLGSVWWGWFIWAGLIFFLGRSFARPRDLVTPLDRRRRVLALMGIIIFILVFVPIPLRVIGA